MPPPRRLLLVGLLAACAPYPYRDGYGRPPGYGGGYRSLPPGSYRDTCRGNDARWHRNGCLVCER